MNEHLAAKDQLKPMDAAVWREHPQTMRLCYPRRIQPPQGYFNPKWYATSLYSCLRFWQEPEFNMLPHTTGSLCSLSLMKLGVPTYFIKKDYAEAVAQTNPPEDFRLSEIQWPLDGFLFVLPDAFVMQDFGWYTPFIAVVKCAKGIYPDAAQPLPKHEIVYISQIQNDNDRILVHFPLYLNDLPVDYTGAYPLSSPISVIQSAPWADATYYEEQIAQFKFPKATGSVPTAEQEQELQRKINSFAVKLMLALTAEPGYLESGAIQRPQKVNRRGEVEKAELWGPNLLGWKYKVAKPPVNDLGGTHASPRLHWRRGHMTYQVKGQRDALVPIRDLPRKPFSADIPPTEQGKIDWAKVGPEVERAFWQTHALRWIKPVLVNAATKDEA